MVLQGVRELGKKYYFIEFLPVYDHFTNGGESIAFFRFSKWSVTKNRLRNTDIDGEFVYSR